jgi:hypothetical protein
MDITIVLVIILGFSLMILPGYFNIILCKKYYFFKNIAQKKYIYIIWGIYSFLVFLGSLNAGYGIAAAVGSSIGALCALNIFTFLSALLYSTINREVNKIKLSEYFYFASLFNLILGFIILPKFWS